MPFGGVYDDVKNYETTKPRFDIDGYFKSIGEFGTYQQRFFVLLVFLSIIDGFIVVFTVITSTAPDHYCRSYPNETYIPRTETCLCDSFPIDNNDTCHVADQCKRVIASDTNESNATLTFGECDLGWVYDQSIYHSTPVTEWDLVCDRLWQRQLSKTVHMLGRPVGAFLIGVAANRYGSKPVLFVNVLILVGAGLLAATVHSFPVFAVSQFFTGSAGSLVNIGLIYVTELVGPSKRGTLGLLFYLGYPIAAMILSSVVYFMNDWRWLGILLCIVFSIALSYLWIIPESVRWLLANGRGEDAKRILLRAAVVNKATLSVDKLAEVNSLHTNSEDYNMKSYGLADVIKKPLLRKTLLNMCFQWSVTYAVYIGLSTNTDFLAGHDLLNMFLTGLAEVPALVMTAVFLDRIGRRFTSLCGYIVSGVALALVAIIPEGHDNIVVAIAVTGKFGISVGFAVICVYTTELIPTPVRQVGVGLCSAFGRISAAMTPMLFTLGELYWWPLPYVLFSSALCCGAMFLCTLPETTGKDLPQTMEDGEEFIRTEGRRCIMSCRNNSYQHCEIDTSVPYQEATPV